MQPASKPLFPFLPESHRSPCEGGEGGRVHKFIKASRKHWTINNFFDNTTVLFGQKKCCVKWVIISVLLTQRKGSFHIKHFWLVENSTTHARYLRVWLVVLSVSEQGQIQGEGAGGATPPPPEMTCGFLIQLVFCKKRKTMWFIGVEVEQETSAPPPKKILDPPMRRSRVSCFHGCHSAKSSLWSRSGHLSGDEKKKWALWRLPQL